MITHKNDEIISKANVTIKGKFVYVALARLLFLILVGSLYHIIRPPVLPESSANSALEISYTQNGGNRGIFRPKINIFKFFSKFVD